MIMKRRYVKKCPGCGGLPIVRFLDEFKGYCFAECFNCGQFGTVTKEWSVYALRAWNRFVEEIEARSKGITKNDMARSSCECNG